MNSSLLVILSCLKILARSKLLNVTLSLAGFCPTFCGEQGYCCRKGFTGCPSTIPPEILLDNHYCVRPGPVGVGKPVNITHILQREYFKLDIVFGKPGVHYEKHTEFHFAFLKERLQERRISKTPPDDQLNVVLVLIDSLSHAHAQRSLKKTYSFLKVFFGYIIYAGVQKLYRGSIVL